MSSRPIEVECKFCREAGLYWMYDGVSHVLVDDEGERHDCQQREAASADDFDD